jgi:hypothetical protein
MIQITSKLGGANESVALFMQLAPKMFNEVLENSINETAKILHDEAKEQTPRKWGVQEDIRDIKHSAIKKASAQAGAKAADIILSGNSISLFKLRFVSRRNIMAGKTRGGITVNVAGKTYNFPHAFVTDMGHGKASLGIYDRIRGKRGGNSVKKMYTAHLAGEAKSEKTTMPLNLQLRAQEVFEHEFIKECDKRLTAMGAK